SKWWISFIAYSCGQAKIGLQGYVPPFVAIHGLVSAAKGSNSHLWIGLEFFVEIEHKLLGAVRWRISAVEKKMEINSSDPFPAGHFNQGFHMSLMAMHTTVSQQTQQVQPAALIPRLSHRI